MKSTVAAWPTANEAPGLATPELGAPELAGAAADDEAPAWLVVEEEDEPPPQPASPTASATATAAAATCRGGWALIKQ
jgi:hypothetical protein